MRDFESGDIIVPRKYLREWTTAAIVVDQIEGDGSLLAYPLGGGFRLRFSPIKVEEFDFIKVPQDKLDNPGWSSVQVYAEWTDKKYQAWTTGRRWNGWVMPHFEFEEAMKYSKDTQGDKYASPTIYDPVRDAFITTREEQDEEEVDEATVIYVRGRGPLKVYPVGAGSWTWELAPEEEKEDE